MSRGSHLRRSQANRRAFNNSIQVDKSKSQTTNDMMFGTENTLDSAIANRTGPLNKVYNGIPFHHKRTSDI